MNSNKAKAYNLRIDQKLGLDSGEFDSASQRFESAFHCSVTSVNSILFEYSVTIRSTLGCISIDADDVMPFGLERCEVLVMDAFKDSCQNLYPEFGLVRVTQV